MKKISVLIIKEWKSFFYTPFAMVLITAFVFICSNSFVSHLTSYLLFTRPTEILTPTEGITVTNNLLTPYFRDMITFLVLFLPLMTMRSFAEDKKLGNYELLISYPIKPWEMLLGKYLGVLSIALVLLILSMIFPAVVFWKGTPYLPQVGTAYLGFFLFVLLYVSIGVVASLFTENQLIAALITYAFYFSTYLFQWLAFNLSKPFDQIFSNYLFVSHLHSFIKGLVFLGDLVMYPATAALVLLAGFWKIRRHFVR